MKLIIDDGDKVHIEHLGSHEELLLRAAYVAVLLKNELTDSFGQGQINIFREHLIKIPISMEFIMDDGFLDLLEHWFKGRLLESLKPYDDENSLPEPFPFADLCQKIRIAAGFPEDKQDIVTAWLNQEAWEAKIAKIKRKMDENK